VVTMALLLLHCASPERRLAQIMKDAAGGADVSSSTSSLPLSLGGYADKMPPLSLPSSSSATAGLQSAADTNGAETIHEAFASMAERHTQQRSRLRNLQKNIFMHSKGKGKGRSSSKSKKGSMSKKGTMSKGGCVVSKSGGKGMGMGMPSKSKKGKGGKASSKSKVLCKPIMKPTRKPVVMTSRPRTPKPTISGGTPGPTLPPVRIPTSAPATGAPAPPTPPTPPTSPPTRSPTRPPTSRPTAPPTSAPAIRRVRGKDRWWLEGVGEDQPSTSPSTSPSDVPTFKPVEPLRSREGWRQWLAEGGGEP
jgi:hypothetical protein